MTDTFHEGETQTERPRFTLRHRIYLELRTLAGTFAARRFRRTYGAESWTAEELERVRVEAAKSPVRPEAAELAEMATLTESDVSMLERSTRGGAQEFTYDDLYDDGAEIERLGDSGIDHEASDEVVG